jgi:hypothetical protein
MKQEIANSGLGPSTRPPEIDDKEIESALKVIAQHAFQRTVMNQCGGLPGPPVERRTFARRILSFIERLAPGSRP